LARNRTASSSQRSRRSSTRANSRR